MLTVITVAVLFIAVLQATVHWKIVREGLLWAAAIFSLLGILASLVVFILAFIYLDTKLTWMEGSNATAAMFLLVGVALVVVAGGLSAIEEWDRNTQLAKWRTQLYEEKAAEYREYADKGRAWAQYELGQMYEAGLGVPQDNMQALEWFRRAADQGNAEAQLKLGVMNAECRNVP